MRTLRVFESISIDGYFTDAAGDMSWAHSHDAEFSAFVADNAGGGGDLLLGRTTYEMMAAFWPTFAAAAQMPVVAKGMNAARKYVVSSAASLPAWTNTEVLRGDIESMVGALKRSDGPGITVLGSGQLAAALGALGLVDEYQFVIVPVALGGGRTVFADRRGLTLVSSRAFQNGNVVVTYAV